MMEEAAEKLFREDGQRGLSAALGIALPTKADRFLRDREHTVVGDGDPMGVASEIVENRLGSAEGRLGVDHPILSKQSFAGTLRSCWVRSERHTRRKRRDGGATLQFTATGTFSDGKTVDLTNQVNWSSSAPTFATISSTGLVSGAAAGQTTISASFTQPGQPPITVSDSTVLTLQ